MQAVVNQTINKKIRLIMELRNKGVTDMAVLGAMEKVPRDEFVPQAAKGQAWDDTALPIGLGQTISQPLVVASMTEALQLAHTDTVLEIGTGCGYQTAILAHLCRRVYTIERHKPLQEQAEKRLDELKIRNVTSIAADGMLGWPAFSKVSAGQAPEKETPQFDKIIVTAAARKDPPKALLDQLRVNGRIVIPIGESGDQVLKLYTKESDEEFAIKDLMPVRFVPLLPDVE